MHAPSSSTSILLLVILLRADATSEANHYTPISSDLKYLKCGVCEETASVLHAYVEGLATTLGKTPSEGQVGEVKNAGEAFMGFRRSKESATPTPRSLELGS